MIKVFRYSVDGFIPKKQTRHYNLYQSFREPPNITGMNEWEKQLILDSYNKEKHKIKDFNFDDWKSGVFIFLGELPEEKWINQSLNHLEDQSRLKLYEGKINGFELIYPTYGLIPTIEIARHIVIKYGLGTPCYIPERVKIYE
jgi:hypothetical protein